MATPQALQQARERKRSLYEVRTRFKDERGEPTYTNHLILEDSPYLLQHAHNPVDWYPWGDEAFDKATREDKPVFLSIGYSTCHWCHVMEEESFDDEEVANVLNRHFVSIKVDREQRPDLDEIYMTGVQLVSGRGGWPMSSFLTPQGKPFFGATYFPKEHFLELLDKVQRTWHENRSDLVEDAADLNEAIRQQLAPSASAQLPSELIDKVVEALVQHADTTHGGFGDAPKFPQEPNLLLLLEQIQRDSQLLPRQPAWMALRQALDAMLQGGIYDQVGGGFHRYATDRKWQVPHFEKMLYNQGQLTMVYLWAWQLSGHDEYRRIVEETLDYVLREMRAPSGGFYSATDADSEGEEGKFFVWKHDELGALLERDAMVLCEQVYGVTHKGNFEGANVLYLPQPLDTAAEALALPRPSLDTALSDLKRQLYTVRSKRPAPLRDNKQITEWNGMIIAALAQAADVLKRDGYRDAAIAAAEFLWQHHHDNIQGQLWRTSLDGVASTPAQLEDYAHYLNALVALYDTTGERRWLERARLLLDELVSRHWDEDDGGFFVASVNSEGPQLLRSKSLMDSATISGNSLILPVLIALHRRTGDTGLRPLIERQITAFSGRIAQTPLAGPVFLQGIRQWESPTPAPFQYLADGAIHVRCHSERLDDTRLKATFIIDIAPGWHIQGHDSDTPEATRLTIRNTDDWQEEQIDYPISERGSSESEGNNDAPTIHSGRVTATLMANASSPPSRAPVVELWLQPCTEAECLPVERRTFVLHG
ncbi:hypothetical protein L861_22625 [Litchfieldella anticariensis FP35 = DSM 16096]|uniref:Spermatogenesis-associated protein 20-like TRX domain-containing protein n=1 Tax=Litchfieldella anticariensis (strain DSM 16096 / CECT 5854 / CIP 108499 / LMG 22089 / FP35) TaxID=1121939 RepID=S2KRI5_LITA3|nr:DUF255 domain-containing protein [Halomonas anticariensis]EPC03108.1 hypothetical protein L861_22625 [Halomonas anticariensis FP35 = DSM 16096]